MVLGGGAVSHERGTLVGFTVCWETVTNHWYKLNIPTFGALTFLVSSGKLQSHMASLQIPRALKSSVGLSMALRGSRGGGGGWLRMSNSPLCNEPSGKSERPLFNTNKADM